MSDFDSNKFKTKRQDWETPQELFDYLNDEFKFELDLAGNKTNTKCKRFYSEDSLNKVWFDRCWLNPPYGSKKSQLKVWVKKAFEESQKENCLIVMLVPARTNTNWWHDYCMKAKEVRFIKGRPKFKGCSHGLPFPLSIVIFDNSNDETKYSTLDYRNLNPINPNKTNDIKEMIV